MLKVLTKWCFGYKEACCNNNVAQEENQSLHVVRCPIL